MCLNIDPPVGQLPVDVPGLQLGGDDDLHVVDDGLPGPAHRQGALVQA